MGTIPVWLKDFIEKHNATGSEVGIAGVLNHYPLVMRVGRLLLGAPKFLEELTALVVHHEPPVEVQPALGRMPTDFTKLHGWMERAFTEFLGFEVTLPEPPTFNQRQRRLLKRMKLRVIFLPDLPDHKLKALAVKPAWGQYLDVGQIQRIALPGKWVAYEVIAKPNYSEGKYADDQLMAAIGIDSRFNHPHSGKGEGDDLEEDILPKVAAVLAPLEGKVMVQSAEEFNFLGNFLNWLREKTGEDFPDLGSTDSWEWCRNSYDAHSRLIVGHRGYGGLSAVSGRWRYSRDISIAFRVLVVLG